MLWVEGGSETNNYFMTLKLVLALDRLTQAEALMPLGLSHKSLDYLGIKRTTGKEHYFSRTRRQQDTPTDT